MRQKAAAVSPDPWYEWLLHSRHADDPVEHQIVLGEVARYADRVLAGANLLPGMTLADVGSGEGLIAFKAIDHIGPNLQVILTDISPSLLEHSRKLAIHTGVLNQCTFIEANAERLHGIEDSSVDVVATRATLAYVADKSSALREFHRILRPGGRVSLAEPIMFDEAQATCALRTAARKNSANDVDPFLSLMHRWKAAQFPDTIKKMSLCPMTNFSERDLVRLAQQCGFKEIHLELHIDVRPFEVSSWEAFTFSAPHPLAPSLSTILTDYFTSAERVNFESVMRPMIEEGDLYVYDRVAYLTASKNN